MAAVGKAPRRSKAATLATLKRKLGMLKMVEIDRQRLIKFGHERADEGCGPVTLGIDIGTIKLVLSHAAAVHSLPFQSSPSISRVLRSSAYTSSTEGWKGIDGRRRKSSTVSSRISRQTHGKSHRQAASSDLPSPLPCARRRFAACDGRI